MTDLAPCTVTLPQDEKSRDKEARHSPRLSLYDFVCAFPMVSVLSSFGMFFRKEMCMNDGCTPRCFNSEGKVSKNELFLWSSKILNNFRFQFSSSNTQGHLLRREPLSVDYWQSAFASRELQ